MNVEYVSANPTGPMHVGHCRGAVFGDALANLLAFAGFAVTREYYVNDAGAQVDALARSAFLRYREALGEDIGEIPEGLYPGDYLKPVGAEARRPARQGAARDARSAVAPHRARRRAASDARHDRGRSRRSSASATTCSSPSARSAKARATRSPRPSPTSRPRGLIYQGPPAAAQGQGRRGLGGPRAAPVPLHRVRRRHRPAAGQVRRHATPISLATSPITATSSDAASRP